MKLLGKDKFAFSFSFCAIVVSNRYFWCIGLHLDGCDNMADGGNLVISFTPLYFFFWYLVDFKAFSGLIRI